MFNNLLSLLAFCLNREFTVQQSLKKDSFSFEVFCDNKQILGNLTNFIAFDDSTNIYVSNNITENIVFFFVDYSLLPKDLDKKLNYSPYIKVHGGTPEQHMYANKYCEYGLTLYRINSGKPQYVMHNNSKNIFILFGNAQTLTFDLLRIVREVYYRKCLKLGRVAFHAASVVNESGECILISGQKGSGKSTLLYNILHDTNLMFLDNDRVMLGVTNDKIIAHSMSSTVNIAYGTLSNYSDIPVNVRPTDKIKLSRFDFINQLNCKSRTVGIVKGIIFPQISAECFQFSSQRCNCQEATQLFLPSIESLDNDEHPDWLGLANINIEDYNNRIQALIKTLQALDSFKVFYGYKLLSSSQIKNFCKI